MAKLLYKYLDAKGGKAMLEKHNLQFTHVSRLNDPFDCVPDLIDFSNVPEGKCKVWPPKIIQLLDSQEYKRQWEQTWICSLSKVHDNLLMWSYYGAHRGICIGIDMEKADKYLSRIMNGVYIGVEKVDVQYKDIGKKPDYYHDRIFVNHLNYQLSTKAIDWAHEQEVRLVMRNPTIGLIPYDVPDYAKPKDENGAIDKKDCRFYPQIGGECFSELYLGVYIRQEDQDNLIQMAKKINPDIKIYQMVRDLEKFNLFAESLP